MWKECKIYLINTNKEPDFGDLCKSARYPGKLLILGQFENSYSNECMQFNLIITSDEEIKEGNWFFDTITNTIHLCNEVNNNICSGLNHGVYHGKFEYKKIISSTNPFAHNLPQPTKEWIEYFIKEYNKGNIVEKCLVEYNEFLELNDPRGKYTTYELNLSDNNISIKSIEPVLYTEEEVKIISHNSYNYGFKGGLYEYSGMQSKEHSCNSFDEWFEQNKKK